MNGRHASSVKARLSGRPMLVCGTQVWGAGEEIAEKALTDEMFFRTVVCLRRDTPSWWQGVAMRQARISYHHFPVPSADDPRGMTAAICSLLRDLLPSVKRPVLVFCQRGCNRTGIVAGVLRFLKTKRLSDGLKEYRRRAGPRRRLTEERILQLLCSHCAKSDRSATKSKN